MGIVDNIVVLENRNKIATSYIDTNNDISDHPINNSDELSSVNAILQ